MKRTPTILPWCWLQYKVGLFLQPPYQTLGPKEGYIHCLQQKGIEARLPQSDVNIATYHPADGRLINVPQRGPHPNHQNLWTSHHMSKGTLQLWLKGQTLRCWKLSWIIWVSPQCHHKCPHKREIWLQQKKTMCQLRQDAMPLALKLKEGAQSPSMQRIRL